MNKMNKRGFVLRDWVVASILFSGIIAMAILSVASLSEDYNNPNVVDAEFQSKFDRFENETDRAAELFSTATSKEGLSLVGTFDVLFGSTFTVISLVFGSVSAIGEQIAGFGEYFGIPSDVSKVFFTILLACISVLIVFIVISSVSRRDI